MIIEDDVEFENKFFERLREVWINDFDMLFLNGTVKKSLPHNTNLVKGLEVYGAFGYIVNRRFYDMVLNLLKGSDYPADTIYAKNMALYKVYKLRTPLIFHKAGMSDIMGIIPKNYKHLEKRGTKRV